jgi:hypothetical protein
MPIEINEAFINRVIAELRSIRFTVPDALTGGPNGVPMNALVVVPGSNNWSTANLLQTTVRNVGNSIDQRLVAFADQTDRHGTGLQRYLEETDNVESLNSGDAAAFASRFTSSSSTSTA